MIKKIPARKITISADQAGQRIDNYLQTLLKGVPKTRVYKMLRKGEVRVNGGRKKPLYKLQAEDIVRVPPVTVAPESEGPSANLEAVKSLESHIIYESKRVLVLNKPAGIAVHGGSGLSFGVIEALRSLRPQAPYLELVHRLDRETSGCLLIAKKRSTLRYLHEQLRAHQIDKRYLALVEGHWPQKLRTVSYPLAKSHLKSGERISIVSSDGKESKTKFSQINEYAKTSLIEASPITGRTHQIRVHCAESGYPICGDKRYNTDPQTDIASRLFLHAHQLSFKEHQDEPALTIDAPVDKLWQSTILELEND
jgi:23S rRNA pseudouridine955/2504/2580 synthase